MKNQFAEELIIGVLKEAGHQRCHVLKLDDQTPKEFLGYFFTADS